MRIATSADRAWLTFALLCICWCYGSTASVAQDIEYVEPPLIDQQPFDLITLTEAEGGDSVKVLPLAFRTTPSNSDPRSKLEVVLVQFQDRKYEVRWGSIAEIGFFEQRIYDEALAAIESKEFVTAFSNLSYLMKNYPKMPRLETLRQEFIFQSAIDRFGKGELRQTLSALEELRETAPGFRATAVETALSRVADSLITEYQKDGKLGTAQTLLSRIKNKYGPSLPVVGNWEKRLETMALGKKDEALRLMRQGKFREARDAAVAMISIFPDLDEAQELIERINAAHPMVRVGVMQKSGKLDPTSLIDWPARRAGKLVYRSLFQFDKVGSEGGNYSFALGRGVLSDDRRQLLLTLDQSQPGTLDGFGLAQKLVQRADPQHGTYDPSWAAIFESVSAQSTNPLIVQLRRPNVLPQALMQWTLTEEADGENALLGEYELAANDDSETSFQVRAANRTTIPQGQPVEIIEVFYDDAKKAVNDLLTGDIDVLDQLYPADAQRLSSQRRLQVGSYALPTTHMLIPTSDHEYLAREKFRRALLYALNREAMLSGELLNSTNLSDGRLISGPFPLGEGDSSPLSYAYNKNVQPTEYSPQLARLLIVMTKQELFEAAEKRRTKPPELEKLIIGCPDFEFARVAVQAMIQQWSLVGVTAELKVLPSGQFDREAGCDLIYVSTTMWEPATDIERLLGGNGIAKSDSPFVVQGLEQLRNSRNWREVRKALQDLHQLIDYHLPVLPLWQVTDRFAYSSYVSGLKNDPVSLYQDIANWRVNLGELRTTGR